MGKFILMGVSGCGKSSVGKAVADALDMDFVDGDDLHPQANIDKMAQGIPLNDEDREPWLGLVGEGLRDSARPILIGCSALKKTYRNWIRDKAGDRVHFVHLAADFSVLEARVNARVDHFMPTGLLQSQFAALEHLKPDETGVVIDISQDFDTVVSECISYAKGSLES